MFPPQTIYNKAATMDMNMPNPNPRGERSADPSARLCATGPDVMDLAAYVDETLSDQLRRSIEEHLAGCQACRAAVDDAIQHRVERDETPLVFVPPAIIEAAAALVIRDREWQSQSQMPKNARAPAHWMTIVRRGVAAAALVAICFAGYAVGALISAPKSDASDSLGVAMSFGLTDSSDQSADENELFALSLSEASS